MSEAFQPTNPVALAPSRPPRSRKTPRAEQLAQLQLAESGQAPSRRRPRSPDTSSAWLTQFSRTETRWIIQQLRALARLLAAPTINEISRLKQEEKLQKEQAEESSARAVHLIEQAATLREGLGPLVDVADLKAVTGLKTEAREQQQAARKARKKRREAERAWRALEADVPWPAVLLEAAEGWILLHRGDPERAAVVGALSGALRRDLPALTIITEHALREAWSGQKPRDWLRRAGYFPAPAEDLAPAKSYTPGRWRLRRAMTFRDGTEEIEVPAGTVVTALARESLPGAERLAVEKTERGRRERADKARWEYWAEAEVGLSPAQRRQLHERLSLWVEAEKPPPRPINPIALQAGYDRAFTEALQADAKAKREEVTDADWWRWIRWMERNLEPAGREGWRSFLKDAAADNKQGEPPVCRWLVCFRWPAGDGPLRTAIPDRDVTPVKAGKNPPSTPGVDSDKSDGGPHLTLVQSPPEQPAEPAPPRPQPTPSRPPASTPPTPKPSPAAGPVPLFEQPVVALDTETTGRGDVAEVCEIAAVLLDVHGQEIDRFSALGRPKVLHGAAVRQALSFNGIRLADLRAARPIAAVCADFTAWLSGHGNPVCTAYNANFDLRMLARHGVTPTWGMCVAWLTKQLDPGKGGLEGLSGRWGLRSGRQTHRALDDTRLLVAVLVEAMRRLQADPARAALLAQARRAFVAGDPRQAKALTRALTKLRTAGRLL